MTAIATGRGRRLVERFDRSCPDCSQGMWQDGAVLVCRRCDFWAREDGTASARVLCGACGVPAVPAPVCGGCGASSAAVPSWNPGGPAGD
jgi:hypothetical protein